MEEGGLLNTFSLPSQYDSDAGWATWYGSGTKSEITRTHYHASPDPAISALFPEGQQNMRGRIATIEYEDVDDAQYKYKTHYTYDIQGNVSTLINEYPELEGLGQSYKTNRL